MPEGSPDPEFDTVRMHRCLDRARMNDETAREELIRAVGTRLERLARRMLRQFSVVARYEQTDDVLQNAIVRLLKALETIRPENTRAFFGLAAQQIRRELLDLARRYRRLACHQELDAAGFRGAAGADVAEQSPDCDLDLWIEFHEAAERLPAELREVMNLVFYHGWSQARIADLFGVDERTIRRRWNSACVRLRAELGGELPS